MKNVFGCLKFKIVECPCKEFHANAPKTYEEKKN